MDDMGSVFVLNSHATHALVAIQSLGSQGLHVTAGSSKPWNAGRLSRYTRQFRSYPDPESRPEAFLDEIDRELRDGNYDVLLPVNEHTVYLIVKHRARFEEHTTIPFPPFDKLQVGLNKRETVEAARNAGLPQPETLFYEETTIDHVDDVLDYPIVVKPEYGSSGDGVSICNSLNELEEATRKTVDARGPVLFQEFIPKESECGVYTLYDDTSTMVGLTVQHRLRSHPPEGGPSTYRETIVDSRIVELTRQFLEELDWQGLAMAEFRIDARNGEPYLIDLNPRLWGSLALSTFAGVDFPYLLYRLTTEQDVEPHLDYAVGVRARHLLKDTIQLVERDDRVTAVREYVTPSPTPCRFDIISRDDPLPIIGEMAYRGTALYETLSQSNI